MTKSNRGGARSGAGRPAKDNALIQTSVSLSQPQLDKLTRLARAQGVPLAAVVRTAVDALPEEKTT
jgi:hypothetical protein